MWDIRRRSDNSKTKVVNQLIKCHNDENIYINNMSGMFMMTFITKRGAIKGTVSFDTQQAYELINAIVESQPK